MTTYLDSSAVLRMLLDAPGRLHDDSILDGGYSSELLRIEGLRTLQRLRSTGALNDLGLAEHRSAFLQLLRRFQLVAIDSAVQARAAESFPTVLGTLDAIHLATALLVRDSGEDALVIASHDTQLKVAAQALGFQVIG